MHADPLRSMPGPRSGTRIYGRMVGPRSMSSQRQECQQFCLGRRGNICGNIREIDRWKSPIKRQYCISRFYDTT